VRNRINLSRSNYKEPYIRRPYTKRSRGTAAGKSATEMEGRRTRRGKEEGKKGDRTLQREKWSRSRERKREKGTREVHLASGGVLQRQRVCRFSLPPYPLRAAVSCPFCPETSPLLILLRSALIFALSAMRRESFGGKLRIPQLSKPIIHRVRPHT